MQVVLPIQHLDFLFYIGKFGVLFTDYENIFSNICKKKKKKKKKKRDEKCYQHKFICIL